MSYKNGSIIFRFFAIVLLILGTTALLNAQTGPSAEEVLQKAYAKATKEKKNVFVIFTASWCGYCKKMDKSMNDSTIKPLFDKYYVITHLVINEAEKNKHLENPGAKELFQKYAGEKQGIPFWLVMNKDGKLLADSKIRPVGASLDAPGDNIGCPVNENEVAAFIQVLRKTSKLKKEELDLIAARFRKKDKKEH